MPNYYETERYPYYLIKDFFRAQSNISEHHAMSYPDILSDGFFSATDFKYRKGGVHFDLFYRFTDDEQQTPAAGFQRLAPEGDEFEVMYALVYMDPSIDGLWKIETNMIRDEEE